MSLTSFNIITLTNLRGIGNATIIKIGNLITSKKLSIDTLEDLLKVVLLVKPKGNYTMYDMENAKKFASQLMEENEVAGIGVIGYFDDDFPELLKTCVDDSGKVSPPVLLYYKGDRSILKMPKLAVIGTREILPDGEKAGLYLSKEFAERGFCIVSGLALGCDTAGHRGALQAGGKTIAFLAHGLDTIYPPQNEDLATEIVESGGLLMSEYPIGTPLNKYFLVARDRLQAGISSATLVIHTGVRGGTMHAAKATLLSNKPLYTVKFKDENVQNDEKCAGNEYLVNQGARFIRGNDNLDVITEEILSLKSSLL